MTPEPSSLHPLRLDRIKSTQIDEAVYITKDISPRVISKLRLVEGDLRHPCLRAIQSV